jgi:hypothetical protein
MEKPSTRRRREAIQSASCHDLTTSKKLDRTIASDLDQIAELLRMQSFVQHAEVINGSGYGKDGDSDNNKSREGMWVFVLLFIPYLEITGAAILGRRLVLTEHSSRW